MKYLIAALEPNLEAEVHKRFGHAPCWLVVDSETLAFSAIEGAGEDHPRHGIDRIVGLGVSRAIVGNIGPQAFEDLKAAGIAVFSCRRTSARQALKKVERNEVAELTEPTMRVSVHEGHDGAHHGHHHDRSENHQPGEGRHRH